MRATNGHSLRIDQTKIATPVTAAHAPLLSTIIHIRRRRAIFLARPSAWGDSPSGGPDQHKYS
eukprot:13444204-Heterocapsa_arctica.AAC.1